MRVQILAFSSSWFLQLRGMSVGPRVVNSIFFSLFAHFLLGVDAKLNQAGCGLAPPIGWIIGGNPINERKLLPWMVELQVFVPGMAVACGGSIISRSLILTAAHCLIKPNNSQHDAQRVVVYYNTTNHWRGPRVEAMRMRVPADYSHHRLYDVALLKLQTPLTFDAFVKPVCLPVRRIPVWRKKLFAAGWGTIYDGMGLSNILQYVELDALNKALCKKFIDVANSYKGLQFGPAVCTLSYGRGTCVGDSGGPVLLRGVNGRWIQVGVISAGTPCVRGARVVKIFPEVSRYMRWIKKALTQRKGWKPLVVKNYGNLNLNIRRRFQISRY